MVCDKFSIPNPITELGPDIFMLNEQRKLEIIGRLNPNHKFMVCIEWMQIGLNKRLANTLTKQQKKVILKRDALQDKMKETMAEIQVLRDGILEKYSYDIISVQDKELDSHFQGFLSKSPA